MRGTQDILWLGHQRAAYRDGFLPAAHVDAAQNFALTVEFPLDAVFYLAHQQEVIKTLARKVALRAGGKIFGDWSLGRAHGSRPV